LASYHGCKVAVKEINESATDAKALEEFRKETGILCVLKHSFIVHFLGIAFCPPDRLLIVSEYYPQVLSSILTDENIGTDDRERFVLEIAQAMEYLHSKNITHHDLKPENILLDNDLHVKVTDFGLSKESVHFSTLSQTGMIGTPTYMAPELFEYRATYNSLKIDAYAFGVLAWEVLSCKRAYSDNLSLITLYQLVDAIIAGMRPPIPVDWNTMYRRLVCACWDADPNIRPEFSKIVSDLTDETLA